MDSTITQLPNGATFLFAEHPGPAYAVMPVMQTGHLDEIATRPGQAHFIEHLLFEGSSALPPGELTFEYPKRYFQTSNAVTNLDRVVLFQSSDYNYFFMPNELEGGFLPIIANMMALDFKAEVVEQERKRIVSEVKRAIDQDELYEDKARLRREFNHRQYGQDYMLKIKAIGDVAETQAITRDELAAFHRQYYCGRRLVIACAGPAYPQALVDMLSALLQDLPAGAAADPQAFPARPAEGHYTPKDPQDNRINIILPIGAQARQAPGRGQALSIAAGYLDDFWDRFVHQEKGAYSAGFYQARDLHYGEFEFYFPYTDKAQALALTTRFLAHVSQAADTINETLFAQVQRRRLDSYDRYPTTANALTNWNYNGFIDRGTTTTLASARAAWATVTPADVQGYFRQLLDAPIGVYTKGAEAMRIGLSELDAVFAPFRRRPNAGQALDPAQNNGGASLPVGAA